MRVFAVKSQLGREEYARTFHPGFRNPLQNKDLRRVTRSEFTAELRESNGARREDDN